MSNRELIKSTTIVSCGTVTSRVFGFVRDILMASLFGTTMPAEVFAISFSIPSFLRDLVGSSAVEGAFVPVLAEYRATRSEEEFWNLGRNFLYIFIGIILIISACGIIFAPAIARIIAPGFTCDSRKLEMTIELLRIVFPVIFLSGLAIYGTGVLNSLNHFAAPAFGPALLNIVMIFSLVFVCPKIGIVGLAVAVLAGSALQVLVITSVLYKKGFRFTQPKPAVPVAPGKLHIHPAVKKIWKLLIPRFFGVAADQANLIIDNIFSTFEWIVGAGAPAALWYSYRLFHLPLAIFGGALATVALPKMSGEVARKDIITFKNTITFSITSVFITLIPAALGLATLGKPIIRVLFERGEFTAYSTSITSGTLFFFSFGLFAYGGVKILASSFYSLGDTKTPAKLAGIAVLINIILNYILMWPLKIGGIALATSIATIFNFAMLYKSLTKRIGDIGTKVILRSFSRIVLSGGIMACFSYAAGAFLDRLNIGIFVDILGILIIVSVSVAIYIFASLALGIEEVKKFAAWLLRKCGQFS